jgi:hypothetical protein
VTRAGVVPRVPYAAPRWLRADALLYAATGFVAASAAPLSVAVLRTADNSLFLTLLPAHVLLPAVSSGLLLAVPMLSARSVAKVIYTAVLGGPLAGAVAGALTVFLMRCLGFRGVALVNSALLGMPFGAGFGLLLMALASAGVGCRLRPAHDGFDRLLMAIGAWFSIFYGVAALLLGTHALRIMTWAGFAGGVVALAIGGLRQAGRKAWLERVRAGREREWALREWQPLPHADQLKPLFGRVAFACDALVVHVDRSLGHAYRGKSTELAVLLAPGPVQREGR